MCTRLVNERWIATPTKSVASQWRRVLLLRFPVIPHGNNAKEFAALVRRGLKPIDAIRAATINAADLLRVQDRGQIKVGYHADIVGVNENPLEHIETLEKVSFVMKDGVVVK